MGILRRRPRSAGPSPIDPRLGLVTLLAIAERGCQLQNRAEAVLLYSARPVERDAALAREAGYLAGEYHRLFGWASDIRASDVRASDVRAGDIRAGDSSDLQHELAHLLMYHCQILHDAIRLTFPKHHVPDDGRSRSVCVELGPPAQRLRDLTSELRAATARPS